MPSEAAPHSVASICKTDGVLTRRNRTSLADRSWPHLSIRLYSIGARRRTGPGGSGQSIPISSLNQGIARTIKGRRSTTIDAEQSVPLEMGW